MTSQSKPKRLIVARSAGFCWGVNRAFDKVLEVAKNWKGEGSLYTYGPLIHNPEAVLMLEKEGVRVLEDIPASITGAVFIRTHGISPNERSRLKNSGAIIYDVTCPDVGKIQGVVKKHLKDGYHIVIVGNSEHPEVKALLGFAEGNGVCISNLADVNNVSADWKKICIVAQSTQKEEDYLKITEALKKKFSECKIFNTICKATAFRQEEVRRLSKMVDAMVVVGGYNSANTNKLAQISKETGTPTFHIEEAHQLNVNDFKDFSSVGITAGASTPKWSIEKVVAKLREIGYLVVLDSGKDHD